MARWARILFHTSILNHLGVYDDVGGKVDLSVGVC